MPSQSSISVRSDEPKDIEYSEALSDKILHQICEGALLIDICEPEDMPNESQFLIWIRED